MTADAADNFVWVGVAWFGWADDDGVDLALGFDAADEIDVLVGDDADAGGGYAAGVGISLVTAPRIMRGYGIAP